MLFVATGREDEFRLSFRDLFFERWNTVLDDVLTGGARRNGDPAFTWEMWPSAYSELDPNRRYLRVHQNLVIEIDGWADYEANFRYHIYLYLDDAGHVHGHTVRWAYFIESGIKAGGVEEILRPQVIGGMDTLNAELANQLDALSGFSFSDLYYLPGNQVERAATGVFTGRHISDVTIVLEF